MIRLEQILSGFMERYRAPVLTIDSHTEGEPTRLIVGGVDPLAGKTMRAKREEFADRHDWLRLLLTREPRGHRDMFAAVLTEPVSPGAHFGLVYMDAHRYPYLCGHATIGAVTTLVELGTIACRDGESTIVVDTPSGQVEALVTVAGGRVTGVAIDMVPSFVQGTGYAVKVSGFGEVTVDLVCVGGFFAMVSARTAGLVLTAENSAALTGLGMAIIEAANDQLTVHHPGRPEVRTVDVVEFYDEGENGGRSVVIYGESHMDRSPCGTGTSAKMTLLHHQGALGAGELYYNSGPLGTRFAGRVRQAEPIGEYPAVIARIEGAAQITGQHSFVLDDRDPFPTGFLL